MSVGVGATLCRYPGIRTAVWQVATQAAARGRCHKRSRARVIRPFEERHIYAVLVEVLCAVIQDAIEQVQSPTISPHQVGWLIKAAFVPGSGEKQRWWKVTQAAGIKAHRSVNCSVAVVYVCAPTATLCSPPEGRRWECRAGGRGRGRRPASCRPPAPPGAAVVGTPAWP